MQIVYAVLNAVFHIVNKISWNVSFKCWVYITLIDILEKKALCLKKKKE